MITLHKRWNSCRQYRINSQQYCSLGNIHILLDGSADDGLIPLSVGRGWRWSLNWARDESGYRRLLHGVTSQSPKLVHSWVSLLWFWALQILSYRTLSHAHSVVNNSKKRLCCFDPKFVILVASINSWNVQRYFVSWLGILLFPLEHWSFWGDNISGINEYL